MNTQEKYYSDDYNTNKFGLKFLVVVYAVIFIVWLLNVLNIFIIDQNIMNHALLGCTVLFLIFFAGHFFVGFEKEYAKYYYILAIYAVITYMSIFLTYHVVYATIFPMIHALQYRRKSVTLFSYILAQIGIVVSIVVGYNRGLCDANMLLLTYTTTANQIEIFSSSPLVFNNEVFTLLLYYAVPRSIIITAVVPLLNHIANSITEKAIRELEHKKMAETDGLTGLLNKNTFLSEAESIYNSLDQSSGAFIFIDLDHFKEVNDTLGHSIGDVALQEVSEEIKDIFRESDLSGRFGGDEFVVFIKKMPKSLLIDRLEELRRRLEKTYTNDGVSVSISASIGAAYFEKQPDCTFSEIVDIADDQVYTSKNSGKNRVSFTTI